MNNNPEPDKFNTFNISDVYKRDKPDPAKENNNDNKGKEITSADILGENKKETKLSDELKKDNEEKPPVKPEKEEIKNDLIDDLIMEDIDNNNKPSQEKKEGESQSFSTSNMNSLGADSSVGNKNNNFDYVEEADKKV